MQEEWFVAIKIIYVESSITTNISYKRVFFGCISRRFKHNHNEPYWHWHQDGGWHALSIVTHVTAWRRELQLHTSRRQGQPLQFRAKSPCSHVIMLNNSHPHSTAVMLNNSHPHSTVWCWTTYILWTTHILTQQPWCWTTHILTQQPWCWTTHSTAMMLNNSHPHSAAVILNNSHHHSVTMFF